ncbi:RidA family protein [Acuticoccus sp. M5D2P5]|uniref:RidA family protein n=1 Tax=Acuticoccus kalidii TaxID=2910977 RepID=UPI001F2CB252|nr:RidA family protein [Acuticoccus kalidii]MCF3933442.1 RidA family protein [Acuticoccus kalidii]
MARQLISTGSAMEKQAGYSRAVVCGDFAHVAGTTGYDYATMHMPEDVAEQTRNCLKTIKAALEEGGYSMAMVVRATYYVTDRDDIPVIFPILGEAFGEIRPAATMIVCELIDPAMKIEIEVTAQR